MRTITGLILIGALAVGAWGAEAAEKARAWGPYRGANVNRVKTEQDVKDFAAMGGNLLRASFAFRPLMKKTPPYDLDQEMLTFLDQLIDWCEKYKIAVVIDPHTSPGFERNTTTQPQDEFWKDFKWHAHLVRLWDHLAKRYAKRGAVIVGYDLLNEPSLPNGGAKDTPADWNLLVRKLVKTIRKHDKTHPIIIEPPVLLVGRKWTSRLETWDYLDVPPPDANVIYSPHMYAPHQFTHQGIRDRPEGVSYPGTIGGKKWDRAEMERALAKTAAFQRKHDVPMFIGEFSAPRWVGDDGNRYIRDVIEVCETSGWSWAYHSYREADCWDAEKSNTDKKDHARKKSTPRLEILKSFFRRNAAKTAGSYAVVVSRATHGQAAWKKVVDALAAKHSAKVVLYDKAAGESVESLRKQFPRYACFVATPQEATREFVAEVHRLTRTLDDDPYTDVIWGILTGYDAANALRIAQHAEPLTVRRVASGTEVALEMCAEGVWYCELKKNRMVRKQPGGKAVEEKGPDDTTKALVDTLNEYKAQLFVTSGHATTRGWQIGYRYRNGSFRCKEGRLYGADTGGKRHDVDSPSPKVYAPVGNCLMGQVDSTEAMALAWMNSAGVMQMIGYTVPTGYGYGGWGQLDYFVEQPGRFTFAEAFYANHQALLHGLEAASKGGASKAPGALRSSRNLLGDRDVVALYGDPAWEARMAPGDVAWAQTLTQVGGRFTFVLTPKREAKTFAPINTNGSQRGGRPIFALLPHRVKDVKIVEGADLKPLVTDNFLLIPTPRQCDPKRTYKVVFEATRIE